MGSNSHRFVHCRSSFTTSSGAPKEVVPAEVGEYPWAAAPDATHGPTTSTLVERAAGDAAGDDLPFAAGVLVWGSGILSAIVDNIPYAASMGAIVVDLTGDDPGHNVLRRSLALGAELSANVVATLTHDADALGWAGQASGRVCQPVRSKTNSLLSVT